MDLLRRQATATSMTIALKFVVFLCLVIVVPWDERCIVDAIRTKGDVGRRSGGGGTGGGVDAGAGAGGRGELVRSEREEVPTEPSGQERDFRERVSAAPEQPTACAQNIQPTQFMPSWVPVNNIHVSIFLFVSLYFSSIDIYFV